ncbi:hypothetical protein KAR91_32345 [Candidatus Pacearchaeota archaeon]|nr:hypothetical protein [Candidatus Pacearchaeota archaeon]
MVKNNDLKNNNDLKLWLGLIVILAGAFASYVTWGRDVEEMKPKVDRAEKHVTEDEILTPLIQRDIEIIQKTMVKKSDLVKIEADLKTLVGRK